MAALPPAGVDLQAKGFNDYIKKLNAVDKKQQDVFSAKSNILEKSFAKSEKAAKDFKTQLDKTRQAQEKATQEAKKLAQAQKTVAAAQKTATIASAAAVVVIAQQVLQIGKAAFELGKLGAQFEGQQTGLNNLAASFGQSGKAIAKSITRASKGTISDLDALQAANQGLLLGVAKTPAEFEKLTSTALTLGRTLGLTGTQAIEQFTSALGRQSLLILDNFGVSAKQVNAEIERLAQADFGVARAELTEAQKQATFMKAALNIAGDSAAKIGESANSAAESFDRLTTASENFKTQLGLAISDLNEATGFTESLAQGINDMTDAFKVFRSTAEDATLEQQIEALEIKIGNVTQSIEDTKEALPGFLEGLFVGPQEKSLADLQAQLEALNLEKAARDAEDFGNAIDDIPPVVKDNTEAIKAYNQAIKQAEQLQLSFARAAEDTALKLARANEDLAKKQARQIEDVTRKQAQQVAKLENQQKKARDKLLKNQQKQLDKFEGNRRKQITKAENDISKARKEAAEQRKRDQQKLQRDLQQARDRFNLSRLQSERRFNLSEKRLRAEGDILALQELREDFALQQQEEKENFDLSKKETVQSAKEQQKKQANDLETRLDELKTNLEDQRAELLNSFDEQLAQQQEAQAEAQRQQQLAFQQQAAERTIADQRAKEDRDIALAREEQDRRISQGRQLEDLGRSLAEQEDITAEGVNSIAEEFERVFGISGVATNVIAGFSKQARSEFNDLFEEIEDMFKELPVPDKPLVLLTGDVGTRAPEPIVVPTANEVPRFQEGGIVPGPTGSSQFVQAHGGETILPTHQNTQRGQFFRNIIQQAERGTFESFRMSAPVIPAQDVNVTMSGGFNISGEGQANEAILQAAAQEMVENFQVAVRRLRRNN